METSQRKVKIWEKHPVLTLLGALVANLCVVFPWGYVAGRIEDHIASDPKFSDPSESSMHLLGYGLFAFVFLVFMVAVYLTRWCVDSHFVRLCVMVGTSLALMVAWFICVLIMVFIGMGFLARLYS
jgi:hypothetical protein